MTWPAASDARTNTLTSSSAQSTLSPLSGNSSPISLPPRLDLLQFLQKASSALAAEKANHTIAHEINAKGKGWAWKGGRPIDFADPHETYALIGWASRQSFWDASTKGPWASIFTGRWAVLYADLCWSASENRITARDHALYVRDMVADAIRMSK